MAELFLFPETIPVHPIVLLAISKKHYFQTTIDMYSFVRGFICLTLYYNLF